MDCFRFGGDRDLQSTYTLLAARPTLLTDLPGIRTALAEALDRVSPTDILTHLGRDQVAGLRYALRIAKR